MLIAMTKLDIKALRDRVYASLSEQEREEADRVLRAYLAHCTRVYEQSVMKRLLDQSTDGDSTSSGTAV